MPISEQEFILLIGQSERAGLDFKARAYNLSVDADKASLLKDVLCMANTPRDSSSFIILGVKKRPNGPPELWGLDRGLDGADLQGQFKDRVYPIPDFSYSTVLHEGKEFGVIEVPPTRRGPCVPIKDLPPLRGREVYIRRDSMNDVATPEEIAAIVRWVGQEPPALPELAGGEPWADLVNAAGGFRDERAHILLSAIGGQQVGGEVSSLGRVPWSAVIDLDPGSDTGGLLHFAAKELGAHRAIHTVVAGDRVAINRERATYWMFARGLAGRANTISTGSWRDWVKQYQAEMHEQLRRLAAALLPTPATCLVLAYEPELVAHIQSLLQTLIAVFGDAVKVVIATDDLAIYQSLATQYDATLIGIRLYDVCCGLRTAQAAAADQVLHPRTLPMQSGAVVQLDTVDALWFEEELELLYLDHGTTPPKDRNIGRDFLLGNEVSWYELGLHCDVDRDKTPKLRRQLEAELRTKKTVRMNLYHAPGAGGTTVARRLLWDFHTLVPCAILHKTEPLVTAERLARLAAITGQSLFVVVDGAHIAERQTDELYDHIRSRQIAVTLLQVLRRFHEQREDKRAYFLPSALTLGEAHRFVEIFARERPEKRKALEDLNASGTARQRTAFYFGLETFGADFKGLEPYVSARLQGLTSAQRKIMGYVSLAHHYAQRPLNKQAFCDLIGIGKDTLVRLNQTLPASTCELVIEAADGTWRTTHDLVAVEILQQLLWPAGTDRRNWRQNLSTWAGDFAAFCRGNDGVASDELTDIVTRAFIYRDNSELLGTERSGAKSFSQLIEDIPSPEGRLTVLRTLTELYPEASHFWAHLGRFYTIQLRDFPQALACIDRALSFNSGDHVLHHMRGMALRYQITEELRTSNPTMERVTTLLKAASESFGTARRLQPDDEHAYISEVQMIARVLDHIGAAAAREGGTLLGKLGTPATDPYLQDAFQHAEDLLEQVRRNREGEGASPYEEDCRARMDALYGRHDQALQTWDNLLNRPATYGPPVRRQIVWTYLARKQRSWAALDTRELNRIVDLLQTNLEEEPNNDQNLRLWLQAVRRLTTPPDLESIIEKVSYWRTNSGSLDATYYLYVLYALQALEGSRIARENALKFLAESKMLARTRRNRTISIEWIGSGKGIRRLVHHSELGQWDKEQDFWESGARLARIQGRIARIEGNQAGTIETPGELTAFFVPGRQGFSKDRSENQPVEFFLGFSYDGPRAWSVSPADRQK